MHRASEALYPRIDDGRAFQDKLSRNETYDLEKESYSGNPGSNGSSVSFHIGPGCRCAMVGSVFCDVEKSSIKPS